MRLVHQTFLLLLAAVLVTVAAMAALVAVGLERGFVAYINARQQDQLATLGRLVGDEVRRTGSLTAIANDPRAWNRLIARSSGDAETRPQGGEPRPEPQLLPPRRGPGSEPGPPGDRAPPDGGPGSQGLRLERGPPPEFGRRLPPPPPPDPFGVGGRVELLDADKHTIYAPGVARANADAPVERPVRIDERVVAWLRWWPLAHVDRPEDLEFLHSQYARIGWAAGGLILLMACIAPLVARRVTQPLRAVAEATQRIAAGEFDVRLASTRSDEFGALMRNVDTMAASLGRLEQARRRWVAEIAHELRTPLTVLQGELEALADGVRPLDAKAVASLHDETRQLARLVDDLHQLALADLGALPCTMAAMDLGDVISRVTGRYRERAAAKGLELLLTLPRNGVALHGDAQRLTQLVTNLLENSIRYTDAPGRITVRAGGSADDAFVVVEDTAPGVDAAECERLFDPLYRADAARSRRSGGSGLGLAIARAIAVAHGGEIRAVPSSLGGLAITVTLPKHG